MFRRERETLQKLVLVPYRPFRKLSLGIGGFILIIAAAVGGFYAGAHYSISTVGASPEEVKRLRQTVRMYTDQSQSMRDQLSVAMHDRDLVLAATENLRQENKNLLENIATLEDQVAMYKKLLSPKSATAGLNAERLDLRRLPSGKVAYRLLVTQINASARNLDGELSVTLMGGGKRVPVPVGDNRFSLQYFQSLSGEWSLPDGFTPERVDVLLKPAKGSPVQKSFRWNLTP